MYDSIAPLGFHQCNVTARRVFIYRE